MHREPNSDTSWSRWYLLVLLVNVIVVAAFLILTLLYNHAGG